MINIVTTVKKYFIIFALLLGFGISNEYFSQAGGRKREHRNQRRSGGRMFGGAKSKGNADKFAKGAGRKGIIARLFKQDRPAWVYHPTKPGKVQKRESKFLFSRYRTKGKRYNSGVLAKQNADRARRRSRGNAVFSKRKYS